MLSSPLLEQLQDQRMLVHDQDTTNNIWGLDGTMRVDYAQHEPMALFPDQSSTIPNATLTQQRLLEEVMAPAFLGLEAETESDAPRYEPAKSSVPWSDYLKSPTVCTYIYLEMFHMRFASWLPASIMQAGL